MPKKKKPGRPDEDRARLTLHVLRKTKKAIDAKVDKSVKERSTQGRVVDLLLGKAKEGR